MEKPMDKTEENAGGEGDLSMVSKGSRDHMRSNSMCPHLNHAA